MPDTDKPRWMMHGITSEPVENYLYSLLPRRDPVLTEIEAEAAALSPEEAGQLLKEFGVSSPGLDRVVAASYRALDLITFLTTGPDESRAWEVRRGATAPEAASAASTQPSNDATSTASRRSGRSSARV